MRSTSTDFSYFWLHRLHSITGIIFAFAFVGFFLIPYSSVFGGPSEFNRFMVEAARIPMLGWAQIVFIVLPLIFHAAFGLMIVHNCQINVFNYGYYRNWMYALQRVCGIILIPFVLYHVYKTKLAFALNSVPINYDFMHAIFSHSWAKVFYCTGIVCAAFYIGNGFATQTTSWGLAASRRARSTASVVGWVITIVLAAWGLRLVFYF
jgi:succinate dehydrogenase / fumarate reductase cytochrome b subunit